MLHREGAHDAGRPRAQLQHQADSASDHEVRADCLSMSRLEREVVAARELAHRPSSWETKMAVHPWPHSPHWEL